MSKTDSDNEMECEFCGNKLTNEQLSWEEYYELQLCNCDLFKEFNKLKIKNKLLKKKLKQIDIDIGDYK